MGVSGPAGTVAAMSVLAGPLLAAALLLVAAAVGKLTDPAPTRVALRTAGLPGTRWAVWVVVAGELLIAGIAIVAGGRLGAALLAVAYLGFAGFSLRIMSVSRGKASCGCFGASEAPIGKLHVGVNLAIVAIAAAAVVDPVPGIVGQLDGSPLAGIPYLGFSVLLAWLVQLAITALPELQAAARPPRKAAR